MHSLFYYSITLIYLWASLRSCASVEPRHDVLGGANFGSRIFFPHNVPHRLNAAFRISLKKRLFFFNCPERWYGGEALCALWSLKKKKKKKVVSDLFPFTVMSVRSPSFPSIQHNIYNRRPQLIAAWQTARPPAHLCNMLVENGLVNMIKH